MTSIDAAALVLILFLPLNWLVLRHFRQIEAPEYLRRHGVVIVSEYALQARSAAIGEFMGRSIAATVTFKGMVYRFDRVVEARLRERVGAGELFLEPGLVYVLS